MPYTSSDIAEIRKKREERQSTGSGTSGEKWQAADVARIRRESAAAREGGRARRPELDSDLYTRRTGRPAEGTEPRRTATSTRQAEEPGGLLGDLLGMMQRSTELQNQTAYRNQEIEKEGVSLAGRLAAQALDTTPREGSLADKLTQRSADILNEQESRWQEYNEWLEEGSNRELAAAVERMEDSGGQYSLADLAANNDRGWTMEQIEDAAARLADRGLLDKAYSINHRAGKSVAGIGQEAAGAAAMALPVAAQAVEDVIYGTETRPDEIDGLAGDLYRWGSDVYQRGGEDLQASRLGLSDLQELAYGAAESAGENIALGLINPGLLLTEQTARSAGGGIADMAAAGRSAGAAALSGLGHGAISAGMERIGIGQMMRNMGRATGMGVVTDSILDRIAALPGLDRLAPAVAGTVANAGEEAAEEFVQTYADTALDTLLGDMPVAAGEEVCLLINGLGATPKEELYIIYRRVRAKAALALVSPRAQQLMAQYGMELQTASTLLVSMEKNGLITRRSVDHDARLKQVVLTEKARKMHETFLVVAGKVEKSLARGLSEKELHDFFNILDKISDNARNMTI